MTRPTRRLTELRKILRHHASRDNDRAREDAATIAWMIGLAETAVDVASDSDLDGYECREAIRAALGRAIGDQDVAEMVKEE